MESSPASSNLSFASFIRKLSGQKLLIIIITLVLIFLIFYSYFLSNKTFLKEGEIVPYDIYSPTTVRYINEEETENLRKRAEEQVPLIYKKNPFVNETVISDINYLFSVVKSERNNKIKTTNEKCATVEKLLTKAENPRKIAEFLISTDDKNLLLVQNLSLELANDLLNKGVQEEDIKEIPDRIKELVYKKSDRVEIVESVSAIITTTIRPNFVVDELETKKLKEEARQKIVPVIDTILRNEKIASKGDKVTKDILKKLEVTGILSTSSQKNFWIISILYPFLIMILTLFYIYKFGDEKIISDSRYFVMLNALIVLCVALVRLFTLTTYVIFPALFLSILLDVFYKSKFAIFFNSSVILILLSVFGYDIPVIIAYIISGIITIMIFDKFSTPSEFSIKGLYSAISLSICMFIFTSLSELSYIYTNKLNILGVSLLNGLISCFLAMGAIFVIEHTLSLVTPLMLFELSDPNSPLLRKLFEEAPGTYQHSVFIANLASHAASAIGCNSLLARVGSYYHDIGKIEDPLSYTENSSGGNLLDKMDIEDAIKKIKAHVYNGVKIANKYKLPAEIKQFIVEHHGTSKISFLYEKAKKIHGAEIDESLFRYDGPKPETKETAIVMLADAIEASVRSLKDKSAEKIEELVDMILKSRLTDGQFDNAPLTLKELSEIRRSLISTINSLHHLRVPYPEMAKSK
ncbi:MAG TPA: HDIG domain-containing protein [Caldisericia bacterium]|nr:HDIG domain-containing protein [Caldisericia bacterium]